MRLGWDCAEAQFKCAGAEMSRLILIGLIVGALFWLVARWRKKRVSASVPALAPAIITTSAPTAERIFDAVPREGSAATIQGHPPGRRTILIAGALAILSLFTTWGDAFFFRKSGFSLGAAGLLVTWAYPMVAAYWSWRVIPSIAKGFAIVTLLAGLVVLTKASHKKVLFFTVDAAGAGIYFYLAVCTVFVIGVFQYAGAHPFTFKRKV